MRLGQQPRPPGLGVTARREALAIVQPTPVPRRREEIRVNLQLRTAVGVGGSRTSGGVEDAPGF